MKQFFLLLFLALSTQTIFAQESGECHDTKSQSLNRIRKKTRAGVYDNVLMSRYDMHWYFLDLNIERNSTVISGSTTLGARITAVTDTFCFELNQTLTLDSIIWNNQPLPFNRVSNITYARFPSAQAVNSNQYLKVYYKGNASVVGGAAIGDGFSTGTSGTWGNQVTWSLSEPYSAMEWFPCKQFLQDKADSAWVFVTTSNQNKVGSNGVLEGVDSLPNNKVRFRWKTRYMIDYYLISVAVAKYVDYTIWAHPAQLPNDSVKFVNYVYDNPNTLPAFQSQIDSNALVLEYFSDLFGLYPFHEEKYGHAMAPFGGGMEHQTMTSVGNLGNFSLNAHELMHQWWGDHVTCKTWKDIFINEGFASYGEYLAYEHFRGWPAAQAKMQTVHDNVLQDPNAMVWFTDTTDVGRIFSKRLTYDKGSAVVHTLRFVLGDSLFFAGLKNFQNQFSFATASIDDLKQSMETFTGVNLGDYFSQWLYGEGYPTFSAEYFSNGTNLFLKVTHTTSSAFTPLFKTPLEIRCQSASGDTVVRVDLNQNTNTFIIPTAKDITNLNFDPNNWLLNQNGSVVKNPNLVSLSVQDADLQNSVELFPNPAGDRLTLRCGIDPQATVSLQDMQGRTLYQGPCGSIWVADLPKGLYNATVHTRLGRVSRKFVKE